ncbi:MAG: RNA-directed DNA polymerase, partial [Nanoarchaeota archaeon]
MYEKIFIYDSCANRKSKGTLFAIKRFEKFQRKTTNNLTSKGYCFKADIKHYFEEVDHSILLGLIGRKIKDEKVILLIKGILENNVSSNYLGKGMPLGNLTSQFFANVYLHELDYFVKHRLKAKYYLRYVDDFVLLGSSKEKLLSWGGGMAGFLFKDLKLELQPQKSKVI